MSQLQVLTEHGWTVCSVIPYQEAIAKKAAECLTYKNPMQTEIGFLYYPDESMIRIRLGASDGLKFNYFQLKAHDIPNTIHHLISAQDKVDANNYFGFYFDMQAAGDISILAWEQWEKNYR